MFKSTIKKLIVSICTIALCIAPITTNAAPIKKTTQPWKQQYAKFIKRNKSFNSDKNLDYLPVYIDKDNVPELLYFDNENLGILTYKDKKVHDTGFSDKYFFSYLPKQNKFRFAYYDNSKIKSHNYIIVYEAINSLQNGKIKTIHNGKYYIYRNGRQIFYNKGKEISKDKYLKNVEKFYNIKKAVIVNNINQSPMTQKQLMNYLK